MALPTEIWSINEYISNCKQNEVVGESDLSCILNAILQILNMMLESIPLSVSCKSGLCLLLDSDHGEKLESLCELLLNEVERNREEYMQPNDESSIKDMYEKESEILPAAFSNVFGVIVLIIPKCYNLPMFPVIPRMLQVNTTVYMLYDAEASFFKPMFPIIDSTVRASAVESKCYCGSKSSSKPPCIHNMQCICLKNGRDCTHICHCRGCGNKHPASEGKEKRRKCIKHELVLAGTQLGENELQLIEPPSKINSFQHCILESFLLLLLL